MSGDDNQGNDIETILKILFSPRSSHFNQDYRVRTGASRSSIESNISRVNLSYLRSVGELYPSRRRNTLCAIGISNSSRRDSYHLQILRDQGPVVFYIFLDACVPLIGTQIKLAQEWNKSGLEFGQSRKHELIVELIFKGLRKKKASNQAQNLQSQWPRHYLKDFTGNYQVLVYANGPIKLIPFLEVSNLVRRKSLLIHVV